MKIDRVAYFEMGNSIVAFIFQIDQIFINYSYNDDMVSFCYQSRSQKHENMEMGNSILAFIFQIDQIFIYYLWTIGMSFYVKPGDPFDGLAAYFQLFIGE